MFSELEGFADDNNQNHVDENSNEDNDVDDETMSGTHQFHCNSSLPLHLNLEPSPKSVSHLLKTQS